MACMMTLQALSSRSSLCRRASKQGIRPRPVRLPVRVAASAERKLERKMSSLGQCQIAHAEGVEVYCNVMKAASREDGSEVFQFVVVFPQADDALETTEYEAFSSPWYDSVEACRAAVAAFDIRSVMPAAGGGSA